ncbi:hypothetical protein N3114_12715 (plasmid) [Aliarcobacter butzleri]|uniref:hypothetical protein n=1 Tax=Aliarcobacter butzleri TaxID=28197 RepID=UPI0021B37B2E|nr:hypothetical protein [Aliarcobacter butzleri]UXC30717.1 hypothetical protein N3114_12715 [Aliarcobacter butzleri]
MSFNIQEEEKRLKDASKILAKVQEQEKVVKKKQSDFEKENQKLEDMKTEYLRLTKQVTIKEETK